MIRICTSCNRAFDTDDYMNDDLSEDSELCPDCFYSGDYANPEEEDLEDGLDSLYEDAEHGDEDDACVPNGFFDDLDYDDDYSEDDYEEFCDELEGGYVE